MNCWADEPIVQPPGIKCDAVFDQPKTYTLTEDVRCPYAAPGALGLEAALSVHGGAILDMQGHTLDCNGRDVGISIYQATVRNGRVRNCEKGVWATLSAVVERMTLDHNYEGVYISGDNARVSHSRAHHNNGGFVIDGGSNNTVTLNQADHNRGGFGMQDTTAATMTGNISRYNGSDGFGSSSSTGSFAHNLALRNGGYGFSLWLTLGLEASNNYATENGGDGFVMHYEATLRNNTAIANRGHGFHFIRDNDYPGILLLEENAALGHQPPFFDAVDETPFCRKHEWWKNTFTTVSQPCIH